jgi:hypothetical protein
MRQLVTIVVLLLFGVQAAAHGQTADEGSSGSGYFGAPVVKYTFLRNQGAVMFGGRGGWNITPSLVLGGGLYGTVTEVNAPEGAVPDLPYLLDLKLESLAVDLEYAVHPAAPTHLTLNLSFGGAAARYVKDKTNEQEGETDFMFLLEPAVGVEQAVTDWLHLNLALSYRLVSGVGQPGLKEGDLNGVALTLAAKLGQF